MLFGARVRRTFLSPVAGFLMALLVLQLGHDFISPNLFPPLIEVAQAATGTIDPNGDVGTNTGTQFGTCTGGYYGCINDAVRNPTTPNTTNYVQMSGGQQTDSNMTTLTGVQTVTAITVNVYHNETRNNMLLNAALVNSVGTVIAGPTALPYSASNVWSAVPFTSLSLSQADLDGLRVRLTCTNSGNPNRQCNSYAMYADVTYDPVINVTVSASGTQQNVSPGDTNAYFGGQFVIQGTNGSRAVTSVTIAEQGTADAANDLSNIRLYYDRDLTAPYDCASESFSGGETQYGSTLAGGFTASNGDATFTGNINISPTAALCLYMTADIESGATPGDTVELQITNPDSDIVAGGSPVITPTTAVAISGSTIIEQAVVKQEHYHWRNDDGNETGATSVTGGTENTTYDEFPKSTTKRLRFAVFNDGNVDSSAIQYRLEYGVKSDQCSNVASWIDVGAVGGDFDMSNSANLTDGNDTTNISIGIGGVSDPDNDFETPNAAIKDTSSQTASITLDSTDYVDLEYSIIAAGSVVDGTTYCFRLTDAGDASEITYTRYPEATIAADVTVSGIGSETATLSIPSTGQNAGGAFSLVDSAAGSNSLTSVTITASGTIDVQNDLSSIVLRYDVDNTAPYDCASESYASGDSQFGTTVASFNGSNEATFTGSVTISTTETICLYIEYNVDAEATNGEQLDIQIADPSSDIVISGSTVAPAALVNIPGITTFSAPYIEQTNYHWRRNDGTETGASSATGGSEDTALFDQGKNSTIRLRFAIGNTGGASSPSNQYRLEWAQKLSTCSAVTPSEWERVDTASDEWQMSVTGNLTDGANTTDLLIANGGVSDPAGSFLSSNGGVKDTNDTTAGVVLPTNNYLDLEYSILATDSAVQGATYCFRITIAGTALDSYSIYPEVTIKLDTDYKIQRGVATMTADTLTITAGSEYDAPTTSNRAFIRITNTQHTGAGPNTGNSNNNADDVTAYISNPGNITSSITFQRNTGAVGNTRISWEIIEYTGVSGGENEMIVRRHEALSYVDVNTTVNGTVTNTIVDDNDVVVFLTGQDNADAGRNGYNQGLSTAAWNSGTNQAVFTRGGTGAVSNVSYALVEFTGTNWNIQRVEHTYSSASTTETESITALDSLSKAFLHVQKRTAQNNHADFGHEVWLSGIGQVSFLIDGQASTPANHTSVAWVIENTQSVGDVMEVTRSRGTFPSAGSGPEANVLSIGKTLDDLSVSSIFVNNRSDESQRSWPEPILGVRLLSTTQYELWRSDTTAVVPYRTEVVEWPSAARKLTQNDYQIFENTSTSTTPFAAWPADIGTLGENEEMTSSDNPMASGDIARIRMTLRVTAAAMPAGLDSFDLQYARRPEAQSCDAITAWSDVGEIGSTTALWRGVNNDPADGTVLSTDPPDSADLLITLATVAGTYEEENPTALNPYLAFPDDEIEYDWVVQHNGALDKSSYCFRMIEADGTELFDYLDYPVLRTVGYDPRITNWRWYDDETTNPTPTVALAAENVAPTNIANDNAIKLRLVLEESSGASGSNVKFAIQYSEYSDFSQAVFTATSSSGCQENSIWCYYDGFGTDNAVIQTTVISNADSCIAGSGVGCGTYNESISTTTATVDHTALASAEFEFTLQHAGARANTVYYFRLYDLVNDEIVPLASGASYPSLVTEGAQLILSVGGVDANTNIGDIVTDATTTATTIPFGSLTFDTDTEAAQEITVNTNATEGYQVLLSAPQQLLNSYGTQIEPILSSNAVPDGWGDACLSSAVSCSGYHTTDATLSGGALSGRFAPVDSYAALQTSAEEIMYSSLPTVDVHQIVYRLRITELQEAGDYQTNIVYIAVPVF